EARQALTSGDAAAASLKYRIVENLLKVSPRYQQARRDVEPGVVGLPIEDWSPALAAEVRARAGAPTPVSFAAAAPGTLAGLKGLTAVRATGRTGRDLVLAGASGIVVAERSGAGYRAQPPLAGSFEFVEAADVTNSGRFDLVASGALWVAAAPAGWRKTDTPKADAVTPIDYDNDGDLDLFLSSSSGDHLLRNNLDGTWTDATRAAGLSPSIASRGAVAGDFDRDGDPDLVVLRSGGGLLLLDNLRGGRFVEKSAGLPRDGVFRWAAAGDLDADGRLDLVWARSDAAFASGNRGDGTFTAAKALPSAGKPVLADFDNDGFLDLLLAAPGASTMLRGDGVGGFGKWSVGTLPSAIDGEPVDFDGDGDLDLALVTAAGEAALLENRGVNANGWMDVTLEGLPTGSAKVNRAGYGSELELKAQGLYVYRVASRPVTHLGLGARRKAEVLRIVWTNGIPQNELDPRTRVVVKEVQQLKGSCPFLYAFDGRKWSFVTDVLGNSPLGLLYDGVHQAPADTREWLVVREGELAPSDGRLFLE
ncbi:MAG TPA: VCBS repeat-containing protein, partial [Thermoanaerobaculia bacterium]|nr:VCBS repeat-containing protein [Thermoanaerobaculia bacterium]